MQGGKFINGAKYLYTGHARVRLSLYAHILLVRTESFFVNIIMYNRSSYDFAPSEKVLLMSRQDFEIIWLSYGLSLLHFVPFQSNEMNIFKVLLI